MIKSRDSKITLSKQSDQFKNTFVVEGERIYKIWKRDMGIRFFFDGVNGYD